MGGTVKFNLPHLACAAIAVTAMSVAGPVPLGGALPGDQIVLTVTSSGGMLPAAAAALQSPSIAAYGDGRVLTAVENAALQLVPARYELARVDVATVAAYVAGALRSGLLDGSTDFGTPRVTDVATTTVRVDDGSGPAQAVVYALDERFEGGLTEAQRDARNRLRTLIGQARDLAAGAATAPYTPDRVVVYESRARASGEPAGAVWPGPEPESFLVPTRARRSTACGPLVGAPARAAYLAALDNPGARWLVDGATRVLAVNPLPLDGDCP